jgi:hypothetical protein
MIHSHLARIALLVSSVLVVQGQTQTQAKADTRIYSNVEYNDEGGDLLGYEIQFSVSGSQVSGVLRIYQGGCGEPVSVTGKSIGGRFSLRGESRSYGTVEIHGTIDGAGMTATIRMGKRIRPQTVTLKSTSKPHC